MSGKKQNFKEGQRYGRLLVLEEADPVLDNRGKPRRRWVCKCDCGSTVIIRDDSLDAGTKSCGCLQKEKASKFLREHHIVKHGDSFERIHNIWYLIKYRCTNKSSPAYGNYGGRGIKLCDEWFDDIDGYKAFKQWSYDNGYQDNLTIDRIDNDGDYSPNNCRWADKTAQNNNKRNNHYLEHNGEIHTIAEWSKILDISRKVLYARVYRGWDIDRVLTQQPRRSPCVAPV